MVRFKYPTVIAAVKSEKSFDVALTKKTGLIFDLIPNILTVENRSQRAHELGKRIFLHMDLAEGIGKDMSGLSYIRGQGADGVISTRTAMIRMAKEAGLLTVQRFFMVDSQSVQTAAEALRNSKADMVEIMPGLLPKVVAKLAGLTEVPIIAGGLIETEAEVQTAFAAGASAVSTGKTDLWI